MKIVACKFGPRNTTFPFVCVKRGDVESPIECAACDEFDARHPIKQKEPPKPKKKEKTKGRNRSYIDEAQCKHPESVCVDRYGRDANVADLYLGASAFLVLSGPSVLKTDFSLLAKRGVMIMSCNNSPAVLPLPLRPHVWLHTDPARKFCDGLWKDPSVLKFTPVREWSAGRKGEKCICERNADGEIVSTMKPGREYPGVIGFHRNTTFSPSEYCLEPTINRGNDKKHAFGDEEVEANNLPHVINTMFAALRLGLYLGLRKLYLLGVDFKMDPDQPYGFSQAKSTGGVAANNQHFRDMNLMFEKLVPEFNRNQYEVINCTPDSGLTAFKKMDLADAVAEATEGIEQELNTDGWYRGKDE